MKKLLLCTTFFVLAAAVCTGICSKDLKTNFDLLIAHVEGISRGEGGPNLTCYCALMSDQNCAVNNNGSSVCAGGTNAHCWEYNQNCN